MDGREYKRHLWSVALESLLLRDPIQRPFIGRTAAGYCTINTLRQLFHFVQDKFNLK